MIGRTRNLILSLNIAKDSTLAGYQKVPFGPWVRLWTSAHYSGGSGQRWMLTGGQNQFIPVFPFFRGKSTVLQHTPSAQRVAMGAEGSMPARCFWPE